MPENNIPATAPRWLRTAKRTPGRVVTPPVRKTEPSFMHDECANCGGDREVFAAGGGQRLIPCPECVEPEGEHVYPEDECDGAFDLKGER